MEKKRGGGGDGERTSFESQRLAGHQDNIRSFISSFHLVVSLAAFLLPTGARGEIQAGGLVGGAGDVPSAHDAMAVGDGEVQQTSRVEAVSQGGGDLSDEAIDALDGLQHRFAKHRVPEASLIGAGAGIMTGLLHAVQEQGKGPFAVGSALHFVEPFGVYRQGQRALDVLPASDVAVVHPHQAAVVEGVAVAVRDGSLGRGAQVGENEGRCGFRCQSFQVDAIPCWDGGREDARFGPEGGRCVVANAEAIAVVRPSCVLRWRSGAVHREAEVSSP